MSSPSDEHAVTRLHAIDIGIRRVRWVGATFFACLLSLPYQEMAGVVPPPWLPFMGLVIALGIVALNVVSLVGGRTDDLARLQRLSWVQLACDATFVLGIIALFQFDWSDLSWVGLIVLVFEAAVRAQMWGALVTWAATSVGYAAIKLWGASVYGPNPVYDTTKSIAMVSGLVLISGMLSGYLALSLRRESEAHATARADAEHRARLLHVVATASQSMSTVEVEELLEVVADSALQIGFDAAGICRLDARTGTYRVTHGRNLPLPVLYTNHPVDDEVVGAVRARQRTVAGIAARDGSAWAGVLGELGTVTASPVWVAGELVAVLMVGSTEPRELAAHEIESLELLAAQAGAALNTADRFAERRSFEEQLIHQAFHDPLTGLPNRARFLELLETCLAREDGHGEHVGVLFVDLDGFKSINDSLGHDAGDQLLIYVADRLRSSVRPGDTVARLGGDEFTVLLEGFAGLEEATAVTRRIIEHIEEPFVLYGREVLVAASVGVAVGRCGATEPDELLRAADLAMYRAKERGKGRYEVFEEQLATRAVQRLQLETEFRRAVERQEFSLRYQPLVPTGAGKVVAIEAFVCWDHPRRGTLPAREFIELAEETGLIVPLGAWAIEEACRQLQVWDEHLPGHARPRMCVNASPRQLQDRTFPERVAAILDSTGVSPDRLVIEISEQAVAGDEEAMRCVLERLDALGVRIAVDNFGRAYSSMSYLKRFPLSMVKIDASLVGALLENPHDRAVVDSVITFARSLDLEVTAVGVETAEQLDELLAMGCSTAQGRRVCDPVSAAEINEFVAMLAASALTGSNMPRT